MTRRWLTAVAAVALGATTWACSDDDDDAGAPAPTEECDPAQEAAPGSDECEPAAPEDLDGAGLYSTYCASCHQPGGAGLDGVFPPLVDNPLVLASDPTGVIVPILNGRAGMPRWGDELSDGQIAAIVTYLRTDLEGGTADAVDAATVAEVRDERGTHAADH